jgi:hypothetical protein
MWGRGKIGLNFEEWLKSSQWRKRGPLVFNGLVWSAAIASGRGRWKKRELWNSVVWYSTVWYGLL